MREVDTASVEKPPKQKSILDSATSRDMQADLGRRRVFPTIIAINFRPDIILWSNDFKKIVIVEFTVPWREVLPEKENKVPKFSDYIHSRGLRALGFLFDVSCRWLTARSTWRAMTTLGVTGKYEKRKNSEIINTSWKIIMLVVVGKTSAELEAIYRKAVILLIYHSDDVPG